MMKSLTGALVAVAVAVLAVPAIVAPARASEAVAMLSPFAANMAVSGSTSTPVGYARFCEELPRECDNGNGKAGRVVVNEAEFLQLKQVNDEVNRRIQPMTDLDHYGEVERWTFAEDGYGDCEEYVLVKRRELIGLGWPPETLLITVVRDKKNAGHAVLTVVTDRGDLILDNQEAPILLWHETGYRFVKRQAQGNPNHWVSLGDVLAPATVGRAR
ncbi:transglutaminase-like cysteine peptidase [Ancylobacter oerskovii]|uniref:Transglutaminase-like cysteine peptidase n=1 Tax=Ancylobacter oerskovii TaxID=459519 RepID=A0ABW4Z175_9HYPH|nr:transglutaminase-like cysteine peptidase [Ancylobacter oerskovii]MBS7542654.1 transglutaminase-like cysteine peptidase [Ancylobacter oerskovii]